MTTNVSVPCLAPPVTVSKTATVYRCMKSPLDQPNMSIFYTFMHSCTAHQHANVNPSQMKKCIDFNSHMVQTQFGVFLELHKFEHATTLGGAANFCPPSVCAI